MVHLRQHQCNQLILDEAESVQLQGRANEVKLLSHPIALVVCIPYPFGTYQCYDFPTNQFEQELD
jgi:hypothetical protein